MTSLASRVIREFEELAALEPAWWDLWRRCPMATPFQSPAWLLPWWENFHPGDLLTLTVWAGDSLAGMAPFYRESGPLGRRLLPLGISLSDYHDLLVDPDEPQAGEALIAAALALDEAWDSWEWEEAMPASTALALQLPDDVSETLGGASACPVLSLRGSDLNECIPRKQRRGLNLARNRARRRGAVAFIRHARESVTTGLEDLFHLHAARWRVRGEPGVLADAAVQRFHRGAAPRLDQAGLLRLVSLRIDGHVAGVLYGFRHGANAFAYISGIDPALGFDSPGVILFADAIEQALAEGAREFHFLRGRESYKYQWGALDRWNRRRSIRRSAKRDDAA
jgi:CelD/BcsL family acetyltransferase involved in cellulose biosynthesis